MVTRDAQGLLGRRFKGPMQNDIIHSRDFDQIREIHHDPINLEKSFLQQMVKSNSHPTCFVVVVGTVGRAGVAFMKARADHTKENTILSSLSILLHRQRYPVSVYWLFTLVYWFSAPLGTQTIDSALSLGTHWVPKASLAEKRSFKAERFPVHRQGDYKSCSWCTAAAAALAASTCSNGPSLAFPSFAVCTYCGRSSVALFEILFSHLADAAAQRLERDTSSTTKARRSSSR